MITKQPWNPEQYLRFKSERKQPACDLLKLIRPIPGGTLIDLGCGTGELTALFGERLEARLALGIDQNPEMLERAEEFASEKVRFSQGDIGQFTADAPVDLITANASLQWLPDHPRLFSRLSEALKEGGQIAVQMPMNFDFPTHTLAAELAASPKYGIRPMEPNLLSPEEYSQLLYSLGFKEQTVRMNVYPHLLASTTEAVEWVKGSLLTYYQKQLAEERFKEFLKEYGERLLKTLGDQSPFFYPVKRLLILGGSFKII